MNTNTHPPSSPSGLSQNKPPPLDLKKANLIQAHLATIKATDNQSDTKDIKVQLVEARRLAEKLTGEKGEVMLKLEEQLIANQKLHEQNKFLKNKHAEVAQENALLARACTIYGERWKKIQKHFEYFREFYNQFASQGLVSPGGDQQQVGREVRQFKEGFRTERNYDGEALIDTKNTQTRENSERLCMWHVPKSDMFNVHPNEHRDDDPQKAHRPENSRRTEQSGKDAILKIARDVYANPQIAELIPNHRDLVEEDRDRGRLTIDRVYNNMQG